MVQPYGVTQPISTVSLFEIHARRMALGSFAAQNRYLKRESRLPLDQAAYHDFTKSRLRRFRSVHPVRGAFTASFVWDGHPVHTALLYNRNKSILMPGP